MHCYELNLFHVLYVHDVNIHVHVLYVHIYKKILDVLLSDHVMIKGVQLMQVETPNMNASP
jgi:hypothetical protein